MIMICRKTLVFYNPACKTDMHSSEVEYFHFISLPAKRSASFKSTSEMHSEKKRTVEIHETQLHTEQV